MREHERRIAIKKSPSTGMSVVMTMAFRANNIWGEAKEARERIAALTADDPSRFQPWDRQDETGSDVPDIAFEEPAIEIDMIDAPELEADAAPLVTNIATADAKPAPRAASSDIAGNPAPRPETASVIESVSASVAAPVTAAPSAIVPTAERDAEEALTVEAPLERRARDTATFQLALGNAMNGIVGNVRPIGAAATIADASRRAKEEERRKDDKFAVDYARRELQARIDRLAAELAEVREQITKNDERREEIRKAMQAREELRRLKEQGKFDPADPYQRALLDAAGYAADDVRGDDFDSRSRRDDRRDADEDRRIDADTKRLKRKEDKIAHDLDGARRDAAAYDAAVARGERPSTERFRAEAETVAGSRQVGTTIASAERLETKLALAGAVVANVASDKRAEVGEYTSEGVQEVATVTDTGLADFSFDAPPPQSAVADAKATDIFPTAPAVGTAFAAASSGEKGHTPTSELAANEPASPAQTRGTATPAMQG